MGVFDKWCPVVANSRHHSRPGDPKPACERGDRSRLLADCTRALASCSGGEHAAIGELFGVFGPGLNRAVRVRAAKPSLGPHKAHAPVEGRQVSDDHPEPVLCLRDHATAQTPGRSANRLDADEQLIAIFGHRQHPKTWQSQQGVIEFSTVTHGTGSPSLEAFDSHENGEAPCRAGGYLSERGQLFTRPSSLRRASKADTADTTVRPQQPLARFRRVPSHWRSGATCTSRPGPGSARSFAAAVATA